MATLQELDVGDEEASKFKMVVIAGEFNQGFPRDFRKWEHTLKERKF